MSTETVVVGIGPGLDDVVRVARDGAAVALADEALDAMATSRAIVDSIERDRPARLRRLHRLRRAGHTPSSPRSGGPSCSTR